MLYVLIFFVCTGLRVYNTQNYVIVHALYNDY